MSDEEKPPSAAPDSTRARNEESRKVSKLRSDLDDALVRLQKEKESLSAVLRINAELEKRVQRLEFALEPRLKSILTLRPLRVALAERNRIRRERARRDPAAPKAGATEPLLSAPATSAAPAEIVESVREAARARSVIETGAAPADLGVAVFAHDRSDYVVSVLEAPRLQNALSGVHVWIDGDQGDPKKRAETDIVHECVKAFAVKEIHRNRGNFGFRKMMLLAMKYMAARHQKILFLEDDCFPTQGAVSAFSESLDAIKDEPSIFSVYGHPFMIPDEDAGTARFQGWGWATTAEKLMPVWEDLLNCYMMTEAEYLDFVDRTLTPEIEAAIDVTPTRQPTSTLKTFFAWDETLGLLTAARGMKHRKTRERLIYNFGTGTKSAHFKKIEYFRRPPFNMISFDEIWDHYSRK